MALTAALKAQIAAWYKALQQQIPDFIPRAPQRQMIADVAKTLAGDEADIWQLKPRLASVKPSLT